MTELLRVSGAFWVVVIVGVLITLYGAANVYTRTPPRDWLPLALASLVAAPVVEVFGTYLVMSVCGGRCW